MRIMALIVTLTLGACTMEDAAVAPGTETGAELYAAYCAGCHGDDARGGTAIAGRVPPDLTRLAARQGKFDIAYVMSTIDGYARRGTHGPMPEFGALMEGPEEVWIDPNGTPTPTPRSLIVLAAYLEGVQR